MKFLFQIRANFEAVRVCSDIDWIVPKSIVSETQPNGPAYPLALILSPLILTNLTIIENIIILLLEIDRHQCAARILRTAVLYKVLTINSLVAKT